jgi:hypothetical protein
MIQKILIEIATPHSIYDEMIDNILRPNLHLKSELISELAISFLENEDKVNKVIEQGYFTYYFIRSVINNVRSNTSPFYKNCVIKDRFLYENVDIIDEDDIEEKIEKEIKYQKIDKAYVSIPKSYFQEYVFHEYFTKGKTYREIANENGNSFSHCLVFHEVKKVKSQLVNILKESK